MDEDPDETLTISATTDSGLTLSRNSFTVTILDDDGPPTGIRLTAVPASFQENAGANHPVNVTAILTGGEARDSETTVNLMVVGVSATVDDDYTVSSVVSHMTIPANQLRATAMAALSLSVVDDTDIEGAETLEVRGEDQATPALGVTAAIITIEANDGGGSGSGSGGWWRWR